MSSRTVTEIENEINRLLSEHEMDSLDALIREIESTQQQLNEAAAAFKQKAFQKYLSELQSLYDAINVLSDELKKLSSSVHPEILDVLLRNGFSSIDELKAARDEKKMEISNLSAAKKRYRQQQIELNSLNEIINGIEELHLDEMHESTSKDDVANDSNPFDRRSKEQSAGNPPPFQSSKSQPDSPARSEKPNNHDGKKRDLSGGLAKVKEISGLLLEMFEALDSGLERADLKSNKSAEENIKEEEENDVYMLKKLVCGENIEHAYFPIYGVVKAGKSTFMSCLLREKLLPEQALPMTSIPIRLQHSPGAEKTLHMPQCNLWNNCLDGFRNQLIDKTLLNEISLATANDKDMNLAKTQEKIRNNEVRFDEISHGDHIRDQLDLISHFVRLLWVNDIDFETDFSISMDISMLPMIEISMKAFEDFGAQKFSFLDTPGPNEAKALEALQKMGPKIMRVSSGCIFCVPWNQVETEDIQKLYSLVNRTMGGKRVIVILTMMDAFKDSKEALQNILSTVESYFNTNVSVNIHATSGHKLFMIYKLQSFLGNLDPSNLSDITEVFNKIPDLALELGVDTVHTLAFKLSNTELFTHLRDYVETGLKDLNAESLMCDLRLLFSEGELLALRGHVASIESSYERFDKAYKALREFCSSSLNKKNEIQSKLQEINAVYGEVQSELHALKPKLCDEIAKFLKNRASIPIIEFGKKQQWRIIATNERGEEMDIDPIPFRGGKAEIFPWLKDYAEPIFVQYISGFCREHLETVLRELPDIITKAWETIPKLLQKLKDLDSTDSSALNEMCLYFSHSPVVEFSVSEHVKACCKFDASKITFEQQMDQCVMYKATFTKDVSNQFSEKMQSIADQILSLIMADLENIFESYTTFINKENENAKAIFERNAKFLENALQASDIKETINKIADVNVRFRQDLKETKSILE